MAEINLDADRPPETTAPNSRYRILVVDDNHDSALSLGLLLQILGHETSMAYDGVEALEQAAILRPKVILLDIGLPGLDGYEVCQRIRQEPWGSEPVLIALSGWGQEEDKIKSMEAGFNFHITKPVESAALQKLLGGLLTPA